MRSPVSPQRQSPKLIVVLLPDGVMPEWRPACRVVCFMRIAWYRTHSSCALICELMRAGCMG